MGNVIPYYDMKSVNSNCVDELKQVAAKVIDSGNYILSAQNFEEEFARYVGSEHCVAVSSGTSALHLSLLALGVGPGDEVITVSHTFRATVAAIQYVGATPVFVDIDPKTFTMDPNKILNKITSKTKCIIAVHLYGNAADIASIKAYNIPIIEDCSQAHGTTIHGQHVGTFGDIGTFSFYPGKGLGGLGDAGGVVTNNSEIAEKVRALRSWDSSTVGYNYRMDNIQAEFLRVKLKYFDDVLNSKIAVAEQYNKVFKYVNVNTGVRHSYHVYPILVNDRELFFKKISDKIDVKCHYSLPVHKQNSYPDAKLPVTEHVSSSQISIPIYPNVDYKKVIGLIYGHAGSLLQTD